MLSRAGRLSASPALLAVVDVAALRRGSRLRVALPRAERESVPIAS